MSDGATTIPLDGFEVVAVPGKGVFIVDEDSNCWHVAGHSNDEGADNKLERAYAQEVYGS